MDLKDMRCLVAIAETKNITRAAEKLFMTQPSLSRTIRYLEEELHVKLIDHEARPITLTRAGELFYDKARRILKLEKELEDDMARICTGMNVKLRVLYGNGGFMPLVVKALNKFQRVYPDVTTEIKRQYNALALQELKGHECDMCIIHCTELAGDKDVDCKIVRKESLYAFIPKKHPLANRDALSIADLAGQKLCTFERFASPIMFDWIQALLKDVNIQSMTEVPDTITFTLMLMSYNMIGIMPKHTIVVIENQAKAIPIVDTNGIDIVAVWNKGQRNPAVRAFIELLTED